MAVTLADVATAAGLSGSTVSRALSDPEKVNPSTRERVLRIVEQMGYVPNHAARSLTLRRTGLIGLLVPDIANPFFPPIIKSAQARAAATGRAVFIADVDEHPGDEIRRAQQMRERCDGMVIASPRTPESKIDQLAALEPVVFLNREVPGSTSVIIDSNDGMDQAVDHLAALGHTTIAWLNGPRRSWSNTWRQQAVRAACERRGVHLVEFGPYEPQVQSGVHAADLVHACAATAVIAYDDLIALGVMARLAERKVRIGVDVSVIGIDDSPMSAMTYPTLTSVHVPAFEAGRLAVDSLVELIELDGDPVSTGSTHHLDTRLVIRSSTGPAPR
jgi:LacI family transcriptional regulator